MRPTRPRSGEGAKGDPEAEQQAEGGKRDGNTAKGRNQNGEKYGKTGRASQSLPGGHEIGPLPRQQRPKGQHQQQRRHQRAKGEIEERGTDRNSRAGKRVEHQRIERADQNGAHRRCKKQVIENERAFAADGREELEAAGAHREEQEGPADQHRQHSQNDQPRVGSLAKV